VALRLLVFLHGFLVFFSSLLQLFLFFSGSFVCRFLVLDGGLLGVAGSVRASEDLSSGRYEPCESQHGQKDENGNSFHRDTRANTLNDLTPGGGLEPHITWPWLGEGIEQKALRQARGARQQRAIVTALL
jgi:hypothetical protein